MILVVVCKTKNKVENQYFTGYLLLQVPIHILVVVALQGELNQTQTWSGI
jgi:hypothetical protein